MKDRLILKCPNCGNIIERGSSQCPDCGASLPNSGSYDPFKDKTDHVQMLHYKDSYIPIIALLLVVVMFASLFTYAILMAFQNQGDDIDRTSPYVVKVEPQEGKMMVSPTPTIRIYFNEPMFPSDRIQRALLDVKLYISNSTWIDDKTVEITNVILPHFGNNTMRLTNDPEAEIMDLAGNPFTGDYEWWFHSRPADIEIINPTAYRIKDSNTTHIFGEIKNHEIYYISPGSFEVTSYDENKSVLSISDRGVRTYPDLVKPNETVPFSGHILNRNGTTDSFDIRVNKARIRYPYRYDDLIITDHNGSLISQNNETQYQINGTVFNNGTKGLTLVSVTGIFYNSEDRIMHVKNWVVDIVDFQETDSVDFEIIIFDSECDLGEISRYTLMAHE
jgi:hypothetical protein